MPAVARFAHHHVLGLTLIRASSILVLLPIQASGIGWVPHAKLTSPYAANADYFGNAVAMTAEFGFVGVWQADASGVASGAVDVFRRIATGDAVAGTQSSWVHHMRLVPENGRAGEQFGNAVAAFGDYLIVGAWKATTNRPAAGAAYIFWRDSRGTVSLEDDIWKQSAKIAVSDGDVGDNFGVSVAIQDPFAVVGADNDGFYEGAAYVFVRDDRGTPGERSDDVWPQRLKLNASRRANYDRYGAAVAVTRDHILIGAPGDQDAGSNSGSAYLYVRHDAGTSGSFLDDSWSEQAFLTASDAKGLRSFGNSVVLLPDLAIVGSPGGERFGQIEPPGQVYVFDRSDAGTPNDVSDDGWIQGATLTPLSEHSEGFAYSIAAVGDLAAVGANLVDCGEVVDCGAVYLFRKVAGTWELEERVNAVDPRFGHGFGHALALTEELVFIGAWSDDDQGLASGAAYVFGHKAAPLPPSAQPIRIAGAALAPSGSCQQTRLLGADQRPEDRFGSAVAIDGARLVVGADRRDLSSFDEGIVYVYEWQDETWVRESILTTSDACRQDNFGSSISVDGERILVGADSAGWYCRGSFGNAYVFRRNDGGWQEEARWTASQYGTGFGSAVALRGNVAVVGASSAANVFRFTGNTWARQAKLTPDDLGNLDLFGTAVATDAERVVVGAPHQDSRGRDAGAVYIYRHTGIAWIQEAKFIGSAAREQFGKSVSIDGEWCAVGAWSASDAGPWSGATYLFRFNGTAWVQHARLTPLGGAAGDNFGYAVSLNGHQLLIGAPSDDTVACDGGAAYLFRWNGSHWIEQARLVPNDAFSSSWFGRAVAVGSTYAAISAPADGVAGRNAGAVYAFSDLDNCGPFQTEDACPHARGDRLLAAFEGDRLPYEESGGWRGVPCDRSCIESVEDGSFVVRWPSYGGGPDYRVRLAEAPGGVPGSLWIEWRFRSNHPIPCCFTHCDAHVSIYYGGIQDIVEMNGDFVNSWEGSDAIDGLALDQFHTFRFESVDGLHYRLSVDGTVFKDTEDDGTPGYDSIAFRGDSGCPEEPLVEKKNYWDYVRYGTVGYQEGIVALDPEGVLLDARIHGGIDRFKVRFDTPNYLYVQDLSVQSDSGITPRVVATVRTDSDGPETVEVVLDRPIPFWTTTRIHVDDGVSAHEIVYTFAAGDTDGDGDADLLDTALMQRCFKAPMLTGICNALDVDHNASVSYLDFHAFNLVMTGP